MGSDLNITKKLQDYILSHGLNLHPVQKEILNHNEKLGDIKKLQISTTQAYFFQFLIKTNNIKEILEIGTFTGLSSLSMSLALPKDGKLIALDKDKKTTKVAENFPLFDTLTCATSTCVLSKNICKMIGVQGIIFSTSPTTVIMSPC